MLDDFFLSDSLKNILSEFFSENKILFIYGEAGIGKTTLAREIFKDRIFCTDQDISQTTNNHYKINEGQYTTYNGNDNDYIVI